ncbi:hypothetical protein T492DRAFT_988877 [Pavlovales sp. CCMP2436]|nr:hypothetical protein T492DRAFT_988877 [Pavlovales sp. CCMP2436]|mmetsp:Transcript_15625/g.39765  ORF Transcript_15625/g.39765 Transcript_15625/m.39765 type:complete len:151 (+) Transcript_15625:101-553(+)
MRRHLGSLVVAQPPTPANQAAGAYPAHLIASSINFEQVAKVIAALNLPPGNVVILAITDDGACSQETTTLHSKDALTPAGMPDQPASELRIQEHTTLMAVLGKLSTASSGDFLQSLAASQQMQRDGGSFTALLTVYDSQGGPALLREVNL